MNGINKVILVGNVGEDPRIKNLEGGKMMASFALATSESYKVGDELKTDTEWHNIVVWGKPAGFVEKFVTKGALLGIEGKINTNKWQDKEGNNQFTKQVIADRINLLSKPVETERRENKFDNTSKKQTDDLPF